MPSPVVHLRETDKTKNGYGYIINIMLISALVGMCIKIFFGNSTSADGTFGRANSAIWGYSVVGLSILTIMFVSYAIHNKVSIIEKKGASGIIDFIKGFLTSSGPAMLTIIILFWIVNLNVDYFSRINKGQVASEYYQLSAGTSFLFVFQIILLFQYLKSYIQLKTGTSTDPDAAITQTRLSFATYFVTIINMVVVIMMTIILKFFSTDG
jgi:hypothetical protein